MVEYPYTLKTGSLRDFLNKIPTLGVPEKVTIKYLYGLGYKTVADRRTIKILEFIKFLDGNGKPMQNYIDFRSREKSKSVMSNCLRSTYSELFKTYPDAYKKDPETLRDFFSASVTAGEKVLISTVNTFKVLCEFADFEAAPPPPPPEGEEEEEEEERRRAVVPGLVINLNIALPATEDASVYDKIFESFRKHILTREKS